MAAEILSAPGTEAGPCSAKCAHRDCAATRTMATTKCQRCGKPIGYGRRFYSVGVDSSPYAEGFELAHAECVERDFERVKADFL